MEILIKETGEVKLLTLFNPETGNDWASGFVGNNDTLNTCTIVDGQHTMSQADFNWWEGVILEYKAAVIRLTEFMAVNNEQYLSAMPVSKNVSLMRVLEWADYINSELDKIESK